MKWKSIVSYWPHALIAIALFGYAYLWVNAGAARAAQNEPVMSRAQAVAVWRLSALSHDHRCFRISHTFLPPVRTERRFAPMTQESEKATRNWREIIADSYNENDPGFSVSNNASAEIARKPTNPSH
jgi:hypothetical protein